MALIRCEFFSDVLGLSTSMHVILPQQTSAQIGMAGATLGGDNPTLYLLHGLSDDDSIWLRRTSIERYVAPLGLAVVMPQVHRSFYRDEAYGNRYWTFLSEELPTICRGFFHVSQRRADTFVAGLSMGGYGALNWALRQPERFAAAASLSGVVDLPGMDGWRDGELDPRMWDRVLGGSPAGRRDTTDDLHWLVEQAVADAVTLPALYVGCGTEDRLFPQNQLFVDRLGRLGVPVQTDFGPGEHEWGLWDRMIQDVLAWLPLQALDADPPVGPGSGPAAD
jgi:putative tributyrin esterase